MGIEGVGDSPYLCSVKQIEPWKNIITDIAIATITITSIAMSMSMAATATITSTTITNTTTTTITMKKAEPKRPLCGSASPSGC